MSERKIELKGRVFITFDIEAVTGLHIGGTDAGIEIGGVDKTVIRDKLTNQPYIPGSSLKGKMRSLLDKYNNLPINFPPNKPAFHICQNSSEYETCSVCQVFGVSGEKDFATPTRLVVRDAFLSQNSIERLTIAQTDLPYTEVKTEVSIDRVTSAANLRQMERVPAGAIFGKAEMVYSLYEGMGCSAEKDLERLDVLLEGMQLLEDDYLGGQGSRGSGKIRFRNIKIEFRKDPKEHRQPIATFENGLAEFDTAALQKVQEKIRVAL